MDRIEDETIRYLFFLQRVDRVGRRRNVPYPEVWAEEPDEDGGEPEAVGVSAVDDRQAAAQKAVRTLCRISRKIERKKEKGAGGPPVYRRRSVVETEAAGPCGQEGRAERSVSMW